MDEALILPKLVPPTALTQHLRHTNHHTSLRSQPLDTLPLAATRYLPSCLTQDQSSTTLRAPLRTRPKTSQTERTRFHPKSLPRTPEIPRSLLYFRSPNQHCDSLPDLTPSTASPNLGTRRLSASKPNLNFTNQISAHASSRLR